MELMYFTDVIIPLYWVSRLESQNEMYVLRLEAFELIWDADLNTGNEKGLSRVRPHIRSHNIPKRV